MRGEVRLTAAREADRPAIGHKTWQAESPDDRRGRTHCSSLPACPRTTSLRLALCPSLRVSSFSFVLQRAHLPAFHSHFLTAHNTQFHRSASCSNVLTCLRSIAIFSLHTIQVHRSASCSNVLTCLHSIAIFSLHTIQALCFSIFFLWITFSSVFLTAHKYRHCVSQIFLRITFFFCLSHHGTFSRAKIPDPDDDDGFKLFPSPLCLTQHLQLHPNPRDWKDDSTALLMDLFEENGQFQHNRASNG